MERRSRGTGAPRFLAGESESAAVDVDNVPLMLRMVELVVRGDAGVRKLDGERERRAWPCAAEPGRHRCGRCIVGRRERPDLDSVDQHAQSACLDAWLHAGLGKSVYEDHLAHAIWRWSIVSDTGQLPLDEQVRRVYE